MDRHVIHVSSAKEMLGKSCDAWENVTTETFPLDRRVNDNFSHDHQWILLLAEV
jgi:hypothetical protein